MVGVWERRKATAARKTGAVAARWLLGVSAVRVRPLCASLSAASVVHSRAATLARGRAMEHGEPCHHVRATLESLIRTRNKI